MIKLDSSLKDVEQFIKDETNNDPDIIFRKITFLNHDLCIIFRESISNKNIINDYILEFLVERQNNNQDEIKNMIAYLKNNVPSHKVIPITNYEDLFYNLSSGYTTIFIDGQKQALSFESRLNLSSDIETAKNEKTIKGPKDAFTQNYHTNIGMIRQRIKSKNLWIKEFIVGKHSQTKVGLLYINGITNQELVDTVADKISKINIDAVLDTSYVVSAITGNWRNTLPTIIYTERPDTAAFSLLEGKIIVATENAQTVAIMPTLFTELFSSVEDNYQRPINTNYTIAIRFIAFIITILIPALYIAITTYNHEAIPSGLLINFAIQRDGVPFPSVIEILMMLITFGILKETDARTPNPFGNSLTIVGTLVLGEAAVTAGLVSPVAVIIISMTSIAGLISSYLDVINGLRWWRIFFIILASLAGIIGVTIASFIFIISVSSMKTLGVPYLIPISPFRLKDLAGSIFVTNKNRFFKRRSYNTKNIIRGRDDTI